MIKTTKSNYLLIFRGQSPVLISTLTNP